MNNEFYITTSGGSNNNNASNSYAFLPATSSATPQEVTGCMSGETAAVTMGASPPACDDMRTQPPMASASNAGTPANGGSFLSCITLDDLITAALQCANGVRWKDSIASWTHPRNLYLNCLRLKRQLDTGQYRIGGYVTFHVYEPKRRLIKSPRFRDRVVQRAMCNKGLYRMLTKSNIYDNCACQNGKGTSFALKRMTCHMQRHYRKYGTRGYALKLDISRFFDSIPHGMLKTLTERLIPNAEFLSRVNEVIDTFPDPGLGLGSQLSQLLAIAYLTDIDHYIKEQLHVKGYIRYSDDMILMHPSREFLERAFKDLSSRLKTKGLSLNPKSRIIPLSEGIEFLRFTFRFSSTGRVIRILNERSYRRISRRLKGLRRLVQAGERPAGALLECLASWTAHARMGNTHRKERKLLKILM